MTLPYVLRRASETFGDRIAVHRDGANQTYREFHDRVQRAAAALRRSGAEPGDRVAVLMLNSAAYHELYYATAVAGALIVPLNTRWNIEDVVFALNDSGTRLLIVDQQFAEMARQVKPRVPSLHAVISAAEADWERLIAPPDYITAHEPSENDVSGLYYTSGTTGGPKGVMLTHRNLVSNATHAVMELGLNQDWLHLHSAPMFHLANGSVMFALTLMGAGHAFLPSFDAESVLRCVERYRITNLLLVPTMFNMVMNHPALTRYDTSSLRTLLYGASPMPLPLLERAMAHFHQCRFHHLYGMTETSPLLTHLPPESHSLEGAGEPFAPIRSAGHPVIGAEIRIVDDFDNPLPAREIGEIIARGPMVMKGYWNREEISAEVLRGGWMHTGDMGAMDERGLVHILDRKKDMIKTGGENVYSPEVEAMLCSHPAILEAAVIGVPHETWGETIRAFVVIRPGASLTGPELIAFSRERMTHFKCPTSVAFQDSLPKGGTGKVQKSKLREQELR